MYVAPSIPTHSGEFSWSPISSTLVHGDHEAVLIDTPVTTAQTQGLIDWIKSVIPNKRLTTIYITHGHGDHFFGISLLKKHFPGVTALATAATLTHMKKQTEPAVWDTTWSRFFPGQIDVPVQFAEALAPSNEFFVEGHVFRAVEVGHTDTKDTTVLHIPHLNLVVCGDVVYGDVHQYLVEANTKEKRAEWIAAIEKVKALKPETVVAGHKRPGSVDGVYNLDASQKYIRDFEKLLESSESAEQLYGEMVKMYPNRLNPKPLVSACKAAFAAKQVL